ncbi:glycosyltransferase family 1 protein [Sinomonas gamaensis]|uniref:glycosyltransferase family 1 protein n=1 Tax=Sinomonas gamaensis TaxID=2565624 RepID=UPI00110801E9|nr:glycosyltransferase family 1 protein [Sinomonas gamaensis]
MNNVDILFTHPGGRGWAPVARLARLASRVLEGRLLEYKDTGYSAALVGRGLLPRLRGGARRAVVIAPSPAHLNVILEAMPLRSRYEAVSAWVIDSFWWERIPRIAKKRGRFDYVYVTDDGDQGHWSGVAGDIVKVLPWGTDTLSVRPRPKTVDLQRLGRQPEDWEDDLATKSESLVRGLVFEGRPPFEATDLESQIHVDLALARAKFVLAFSNRVHDTGYTHPEREYLTARWVDSLAHGAVVAGVAPRSAAAKSLLWDAATLDLGGTNRTEGLARLAEAVAVWTPSIAERNRIEAQKRLDWRHRLKVISHDLGLEAPTLERELAELDDESESASLQ